jgi:hypothetical protein
MTMKRLVLHFFLLSMLSSQLLFAIDNLKLNSKLDYSGDGLDGPLIAGDDAQSGFVPGRLNYVIICGEGCSNSKRQAQRTVEPYNKYRRIHFVVIDLDIQRSPEQQKLVKQYCKGYVLHVLVLDAHGEAFSTSLEKSTPSLSRISSRRLLATDQRISADCAVRAVLSDNRNAVAESVVFMPEHSLSRMTR